MKPIKLKVKTKSQNYPIFIGSNLVNNISNVIKNNFISFNKCLIIIDKNIPKKIISTIKKSLKKKDMSILFFKANEKNKNIKIISF